MCFQTTEGTLDGLSPRLYSSADGGSDKFSFESDPTVIGEDDGTSVVVVRNTSNGCHTILTNVKDLEGNIHIVHQFN